MSEKILSPKTAFSAWIIYISFMTFLLFTAYGGHYTLPIPVLEEHHPVSGKPQISEANIRRITGYPSEDIGLRVSGTAQDAETERYLFKEIEAIEEKARVEKARGAVGLPKIDTWIQVDDGSHQFDFMHEGNSLCVQFMIFAAHPSFVTMVTDVPFLFHYRDIIVVMKMYSNLTNIVVRLSCGPECDQNAILLNAHYDTTLGSPGAVDDGLGLLS
jgi:hypothetical protein